MMVSAAFIGPGTVTACTLAGANFGFALLWALLFATLTTIFLQRLSVRVALVSRLGLAQAMMRSFASPLPKYLAGFLLLTALAVGNSAYEAGNISGALLGLEAIGGSDVTVSKHGVIVGIAILAAGLLLISNRQIVERLLIGLVLLMSMAFLAAFFLTKPDFTVILSGFVPQLPDGGLMTAIALIGTTIVPYNLFLHAASARDRWTSAEALPVAETDSAISIGLGGLISMMILATAAASFFGREAEVNNALDMAKQLSPILGSLAPITLGLGLFAAGLTSAITAPLATGYIMQEIFAPGATSGTSPAYKLGIIIVIMSGTIIALTNYKPVEIIFVAQIANGLLLPIIALFLLKIANDRSLLGDYANGLTANLLGGLAVLITVILGFRLISRALGIWP